jgi:hypothetical protein
MSSEFHAAQGEESRYVCGECSEPVFLLVDTSRVYRPCGHDSAAVLANLEATVFGESDIE